MTESGKAYRTLPSQPLRPQSWDCKRGRLWSSGRFISRRSCSRFCAAGTETGLRAEIRDKTPHFDMTQGDIVREMRVTLQPYVFPLTTIDSGGVRSRWARGPCAARQFTLRGIAGVLARRMEGGIGPEGQAVSPRRFSSPRQAPVDSVHAPRSALLWGTCGHGGRGRARLCRVATGRSAPGCSQPLGREAA